MTNLAIVGCGSWGTNYVRVLNELSSSGSSANLRICCDNDANRLVSIKRRYPSLETTKQYTDLIKNRDIDAIFVATPTSTHYDIARESLLQGKHVLVEKPLTLKSTHAEELIRIARDKNLILMVGHVYLYNPAIQKIKTYLLEGELGPLYYLSSIRHGHGPVRQDTNVMWDLASHDISIFLYLLDEMPKNVSAHGSSYLQKGIEDIAALSLEFKKKIVGFVHVSWLDAYKVRKMSVVAKDRMLEFDDLNLAEKIRIFTQSNSQAYPTSYGEFLSQLKSGDISVPYVAPAEPLRIMCEDFLQSIEKNSTPLATGELGLNVVSVLEALQMSLDKGGQSINIK